MTTYTMRQYIAAFALAVPLPIKRPLTRLFDGASSHMDASIDAVATAYGVRLVQIPPNASHLYQPLDVEVFRTIKTILNEQMHSFMISTGKTEMNKKEAVQWASTAWRMGMEEKQEIIASGFEEAGENDSKAQQSLPSWLVTQQVIRSETLLLPPVLDKKARRKTVNVKRRLLTQDDLRNA
uniref:AlNc14C35G3116 protein n=1 Tax=Albugo laibachii Nc14 TaxID=890382 RepID=F0W8J0_9STRA|nr:AlNc14C35G3116 [Albugo laibachii Nc14]|eukprot:CCA17445.1 AlNc14C35G3116 [Albugo laibachii Nc14]